MTEKQKKYIREYMKRYRAAGREKINPQKKKEKDRRYRQSEAGKKALKRFREKNPNYYREYYAKHKDRYRERRLARKANSDERE